MDNENKEKIARRQKNYSLKKEAIETLAGADAQEPEQFSQEELDRYRSKKGLPIPDDIKILLIKVWFPGAVCFFILWGLGLYIGSMLDMLFVLGVVLGMVTDLLTNNVLRFIEKQAGDNRRWIMVNVKGVLGSILNVLYAMVIVVCVYLLYNLINYGISLVTGTVDVVALGVEPILFGVFCTVFDLLFLYIKSLLMRLRPSRSKGGKK